jgi:Na+/H+-dicarboxylate symporter
MEPQSCKAWLQFSLHRCLGIDLTFFQYIQVVILAVVTSIGTAAVPSAGTITLVIILQQFGLPLEAVGII